jgi:tetratricopeptide (TPR) repeat protein
MLESLRAFGGDRLEEAGEAESARAAHAAYFLGLTRDAAPHLTGSAQGEWFARLTDDHDNLRAALDWALAAGDAGTAVGMTSTLWRFWNARGHLHEGRRRVEAVIARFDGEDAIDARLFLAAGTLARAHGDYPAASACFERGLARARAADDRATEATLLHNAGNVALSQGDHRRAAELFEASLAIFRALHDTARETVALANLGAVAHYLGDVATAERSYTAAWKLFEAAGNGRHAALMLGNLALLLATVPERRADARSCGERGLAASRALAFPAGIAVALSGLGFVAEGEGDLAAAADRFAESAEVSRDAEDRSAAATAQGNLARVVADQGDPGRGMALALESFAEFRALGDEHAVATTIELLATIVETAGEAELAVRLHAAAVAALERLQTPMQLSQRDRHARDVGELRLTLGSGFDEAWRDGSALAADDIARLVAPLTPTEAFR